MAPGWKKRNLSKTASRRQAGRCLGVRHPASFGRSASLVAFAAALSGPFSICRASCLLVDSCFCLQLCSSKEGTERERDLHETPSKLVANLLKVRTLIDTSESTSV